MIDYEDIIYEENTIDIHSETFNQDFDEVGWDPKVIDDSDEEAAELYGY